MTAYKRPVFFDRDIKSFSELSADSGLDLGIVARSILAEAALTVGAEAGGDWGVLTVRGYEGTPATTVTGSNIVVGNGPSTGELTVRDENNDTAFQVSGGDYVVRTNVSNVFSKKNGAGTWEPTIILNPYYATATIGGPVDGTVSVKNASDAETIKLDGSNATATVGKLDGTGGRYVINGEPGAEVAFFESTTAGGSRLRMEDLTWSGNIIDAWAKADDCRVEMYGAGGKITLSGTTASITLDGAASKITGLVLSEITGGTDAASKAYVDSIAQGLSIKGACHVSSQGNIEVLATTTEVDGHTLSEGERVLVRYQSDAIENGIYRFNGTGLERAADMAAGSHAAGAFTFVQFGTNADQGWVCTADAPADVVGTDALPWTQFSAAGVIEAGDGLQLIGTVMSAKLDGPTLSASASGLAVVGLPEMFEIGGLATSADVSAENLNTLTAGRASNAIGLHSHSADYTFLAAASGLAAGQAAIVSASYEAAPAGTTSSGAYVVGVVENVDAGQARIVRAGFCSAVLSGATPGDTYYVQADGSLGTALPTSGRVVFVGVAVSELDLFVQIRDFGSILAA